MFGYVKPKAADLLVKEYDFYKATYCGVCRAMKRHTGALSGVTLSYDSVLLALVRMLYLPDGAFATEKKRCIAHPLKKRPMLKENEALVYTARAFAILAYYKMRDDVSDDGVCRGVLLAPVRPILSGGVKKASLPDLNALCKQKLDAISALEAECTPSVDMPAELFGELLGELFAYGMEGRERTAPYALGFHLGKFIYAADAAEDYDADVKGGKYNPYAMIYGKEGLTDENRATIKTALLLECNKIAEAVEFLPFGTRATIENIVKNIVYLGLVERIKFLDPRCEENKLPQGD